MRKTNLEPWPPIAPNRLQRAATLIAQLRKMGYRFYLHGDKRGFGVKKPPSKHISANDDDLLFELRDEVIVALRQEQEESAKNLALSE